MLSALTLKAGLGLLKKAWPFLLIALAVGYVLVLRGNLADAREELQAEQDFREVLKSTLQAPNATRPMLLQVAGARMQESANRRVALERISHEAEQAGKRAKQADAALKKEQEANTRKFAAAQRQINDLKGRKSTGDREADWGLIEEDTKAPWKNWHLFLNKGGTVPIYAADDHVFNAAEFRQTVVVVKFTKYGSYEALVAGFNERYGTDIKPGELFGWALSDGENLCEIHMVDPEQDYQPATLGHEFAHCLYGSWHESRM